MKKGTCKYFNGMMNTHCDAGVCYRDVTTDPDRRLGSALRIPCHSKPTFLSPNQIEEFSKRGTCDKYTEPTDEEVKEFNAKMDAAFLRMTSMLPLLERIKREHKGQSWHGIEECPVCKGKLHLSHASINGHVHGKCETKDCIRFME